MVKFSVKAQVIHGAKQSAEGIPADPEAAGILAASKLNFSDEISSEETAYDGDELDRDVETSLTDKYAKVDFLTLLPALGAITTGQPASAANLPMANWLEACGAKLTAGVGTGLNTLLSFSNAEVSQALLTTEVRKSSADEPGYQKVYRMTDMRGTVDLDLIVGTRPKLKFSFTGNCGDPAREAELAQNYGNQKINLAPVLRRPTILQAELIPFTDNFVGVGTKNICFQKLTAANLFGFNYSRYQMSCEESFSKSAVLSDVLFTILESNVGQGGFHPEFRLNENFKLRITFGISPGYVTSVTFTKLQLVSYANTEISEWTGKDLTFKNRGKVTLEFQNQVDSGVEAGSTKPRFGVGPALLQSNTAGIEDLFESLTPVASASNGSATAGSSGSPISVSPTGTDYTWFFCLASAVPDGIVFNTTLGPDGWNGAGLVGQNTGASASPSETVITFTDGASNLWHGFRQDYYDAPVDFWTTAG